ncbi:uncharacterized protein PV07_01714 [Cladophialophora immunda]|uniref:DUF7923 domain-containing protein n=1 Tax=Cladophialophora immunda TaxID=569365 RepID=A0A0D2BBP6_9EURO|nr:uncharacterized protein PV07_01714 [Cladophialophora immunda]KIW34987.1 hypothetical protein PV07_01714 [Cladophialophora immunda]OQV06083.1 hypothetical protein CLAIMM_10714 [Cladophialophora immunda]
MDSLNSLVQQHLECKKADEARNTFIGRLIQKIDNMQKAMDRNAFIMVLIDGDNMYFLTELVKKGAVGGDEAAKLLRQAVFEYLRHDNNFKHDYKIVIRVYANLKGLSKFYSDMNILPSATSFNQFVLGFNKAHPLCDFMDAGNHEEAADTKLKEHINLYIHNVHCKTLLFGGSSDNTYASFLSSFLIDMDIASRIRLIKGRPFSAEFSSIQDKLQWTEFAAVFRNATPSKERTPDGIRRDTQVWVQQPQTQRSWQRTSSGDRSMASRPKMIADVYGNNVGSNAIATTLLENLYRAERGVDEADTHSWNSSASLKSPSSPTALPRRRADYSADDIVTALIKCVNDMLQKTPKSLDFGDVRRRVESIFGLPSNFWAGDGWTRRSKNIIKRAVESWVERTGNPRPGYATWEFASKPPGQPSPPTNQKTPSSKGRPSPG